MFITVFTTARHLSVLWWATGFQFTLSHFIHSRSILIISSHLCVSLGSGLLPSLPFVPHVKSSSTSLISSNLLIHSLPAAKPLLGRKWMFTQSNVSRIFTNYALREILELLMPTHVHLAIVQAYWHRPSSPAKGLCMTAMLQIWAQIHGPSGILTC
jgi:hypothetical protein